ncbi:MAG: patatin-like phospholipase family protein [Clostridiales bacterium]|jgi:NTE family protein|nr:patatin-like phospholipase family protein [Clostridiales bacterium]
MAIFSKFVKKKKEPVLGLALGGGGARGYAHLGALKAFAEAGLTFPVVAGTSVGAIVGALYAAGANSDDLIHAGVAIDPKEIKTGPIFLASPAKGIENLVRRFLGDMGFKELKYKFACVAVDLIEAKQIILTEGNIARAVSASCAVPGVFQPVVMNGCHLVDGGVLNTIPTDVARVLGADYVVAVDVNPTRGGGTASTSTVEVLQASLRIVTAQNAAYGRANADVLVSAELGDFSASKKNGFEQMMEIGYNAARKEIDNIKALLAQ